MTEADALRVRLWRAASPDVEKPLRLKDQAAREYLRSREGRESPTRLFDPAYYRSQVPAFARENLDPLDHYLRVGWSIGLSPHRAFESDFVAEQLGIANWKEPPLLAYFESSVEVSPHPLFDVAVYAAGVRLDGSAYARLFEMFLETWDSARAPFSRLFSLSYYERAEPVVRLGRMNPLIHYLSTEPSRRRDANPMIHNRWYDERYPAKPGQPIDPLVRFARVGLKQGHLPNPFAATEMKLVNPDSGIPGHMLIDYVDSTVADHAQHSMPAHFKAAAPVQTGKSAPSVRVVSNDEVVAAGA